MAKVIPVRKSGRPRRGGFSPGQLRLTVLAGVFAGLAFHQGAVTRPAAGLVAPTTAAIRVVDGDTFWYEGDKIRIADIDAPETHPPRCAEEAELGEQATQRLDALLRDGPFELHAGARDEDRYGRKLRVVTRDGKSFGDILVAEGLAREWTGRRQPWCA